MAITQLRASKQIAWDADIDLNAKKITNLATPVNATDAATKEYVDNIAAGLDPKASVRLAATTAVANVTYSNGTNGVGATLTNNNGSFPALTIDGVAAAVGNRVLLASQTPSYTNGIYVVTNAGGSGVNFVLTRATDFNSPTTITPNAYVFVEEGTTNADSGWTMIENGTITVGTSSILFVQFSGAGQITAGAGLTKSGNTIDVVGTANRITVNADSVDIASTYVGQASITTLGTITAGTWNGTTIAIANGGTGATSAAAARTNLGLVIGTNVQAWDADLDAIAALAGTSGLLKKTAANTWTLDTTAYATISGAETLTNKTLTDPIINNIKASASSTAGDLWSEITTGSANIAVNAATINIGTTNTTAIITLGAADSIIKLPSATSGLIYAESDGSLISVNYQGQSVTGALPASWSGDTATFTQAGASTKSNIQIWVNGLLMLAGTDYALTNNSGTSFVVNFDDSLGVTSGDNVQAAYIWK